MEDNANSRFLQCQQNLKRTGFEANLTKQQEECLSQLREKLFVSEYGKEAQNQLDGDRFFLRFLRATMKDKNGERIFDVDACYKRLMDQYRWRKEYDIDILQDYVDRGERPEHYDKFRAMYPTLDLINPDTGEVMRIGLFGKFISYLDTKAFTEREWIRWFAYETLLCLQYLREQSRIHNREISTYHSVPDVSGISLVGVGQRIKFIQLMSTVTGLYFPELIQTNYLIRAPWIFPKIANICKPFLDKDTWSKFVMTSGVPTEVFLQIMPKSLLPKEYGGDNEEAIIEIPLCAKPHS